VELRGEADVHGVVAQLDHVDVVSNIDRVPEFFDEEIPLDGESQHDEVKCNSSNG